MDAFLQDFRYATRMLIKNPAFTAVAVLVLALGIGANTSMFSLANALIFKPIVAEDPHELVALFSKDLSRPDSYRPFSYPNYRDLRETNDTFDSLLAHELSIVGLAEGDETRRVFAEVVSHDYFDTFGVSPVRGRFFTEQEERPDSGVPVAVVSYEYWRRNGQAPGLIGESITVNGLTIEIVGIAPENFTGRTAMMSPSLYMPLGLYDRLLSEMFDGDGRPLAERGNHTLLLVGRLRDGLSLDEANARLASLSARLREAYPEINENQEILVTPLTRVSVSTDPGGDSGLAMVAMVLLGMTGIVLLLACLNLANMLLARGASRSREFAIRAAIGGGRTRILRQLLTEGFLLAALGGLIGLAVSSSVTSLLARSMSNVLTLNNLSMDIILRGGPDLRILGATAGFCMVGTLLFALAPAWKQSRPDVMGTLKEQGADGGSGTGRRGLFARGNLLVVSQVALSLVLLVAAGLFMRAAFEAARVDPGFEIDPGLLAELDPGLSGYDEPRSRDLYRQVHERLRAIPGIDTVAVASTVPFGAVSTGRRVRRAEDLPGPDGADVESVSAASMVISGDYFEALGVPLVRGRSFSRAESESDAGPKVVIVDELLAERLWPGQDPIGRQVGFGREPSDTNRDEFEVVGVVQTVRDDLFPAEPGPHVYRPFGQNFQTGMTVHLRTTATNPDVRADLLRAIRREVRAIDPALSVLTLRTLRAHIDESASLWMVKLAATIFSTFGALALFLAVVGVYGVKAYTVARRTREIGIRKALGATSSGTLWLVVREGMMLTAVGLVVGLLMAAGVARLLSSLLYEVGALDPLTFLVAPTVLAASALLATWLPARRAAGVQPVIALRQD